MYTNNPVDYKFQRTFNASRGALVPRFKSYEDKEKKNTENASVVLIVKRLKE